MKVNNQKTKQRVLNKAVLPHPISYYANEFPGLKVKSKYTSVSCPQHKDQQPSLSLNLINGSFKCFSCGAWGSDVIAFQMFRHKMSFVEAVTFLKGWHYV